VAERLPQGWKARGVIKGDHQAFLADIYGATLPTLCHPRQDSLAATWLKDCFDLREKGDYSAALDAGLKALKAYQQSGNAGRHTNCARQLALANLRSPTLIGASIFFSMTKLPPPMSRAWVWMMALPGRAARIPVRLSKTRRLRPLAAFHTRPPGGASHTIMNAIESLFLKNP